MYLLCNEIEQLKYHDMLSPHLIEFKHYITTNNSNQTGQSISNNFKQVKIYPDVLFCKVDEIAIDNFVILN